MDVYKEKTKPPDIKLEQEFGENINKENMEIPLIKQEGIEIFKEPKSESYCFDPVELTQTNYEVDFFNGKIKTEKIDIDDQLLLEIKNYHQTDVSLDFNIKQEDLHSFCDFPDLKTESNGELLLGDTTFNSEGPSGYTKKRKIIVKNPKNLTVAEMMEFLYNSDVDLSESEELVEKYETDESDVEEITERSPTRTSQFDELPLLADVVDVLGNDDNEWHDLIGEMKDFEFSGENKLLINPPESGHPYDWFKMLITDEFLENIISQSNLYAINVLATGSGKKRARIAEWKDLTLPEFRVFFGLTLHMGTIHMSRIQDYWKRHRLFSSCFSNYMSRDRYLVILRCLHFCQNPEADDPPPEDRLYKIRPVLEYFKNRMNQIYYPGKHLSLDESMVLWKGRLIFRQYIKNKRHKYGLKLYVIAEPNGIVLDFAVYAGQLDVLSGKGHVQKVVMYLMRDMLNRGHSLYMDNFYNSYSLAVALLKQKTFCTGTIRADRAGSPKEVIVAKLRKGENKVQFLNGVVIGKWRDKRDVIYISSEYKGEMVGVENRRKQMIQKPLPIVQYNKYMMGVDRQDQFTQYYPVLRKTLRWYKKLAIHVIHLLLVNAYLLCRKYGTRPNLTFYDFRLAVIEKLLPEKVVEPTRKVSQHLPSKIDITNEKGKTLRKKCRVCCKKKIRKDTLYHCSTCPQKPGLCLEPCFQEYHKNTAN